MPFSKPLKSYIRVTRYSINMLSLDVSTYRFKENGEIYTNFSVKRKFDDNLFKT